MISTLRSVRVLIPHTPPPPRHLPILKNSFAEDISIWSEASLLAEIALGQVVNPFTVMSDSQTAQKPRRKTVRQMSVLVKLHMSWGARWTPGSTSQEAVVTKKGTVIQETQRKILVTIAKSHKIMIFFSTSPLLRACLACLYGLKLARTKQFGQRWSFHLWKLCGTKIQMPKLSTSLLEDLQRSSGHHQFESFPQTHEAVSRCFLAESAKALQLQLATAESAQDIANARAFQQALTLPEDWLQVASCRTPNLYIYIQYEVWATHSQQSHPFLPVPFVLTSQSAHFLSQTSTLSKPKRIPVKLLQPASQSKTWIARELLNQKIKKKNINSSGFCIKKHPTLRRVKRRKGESEVKMSCLSHLRPGIIFATKNRRTSSNYRGTHRNLEPLLVCLPNQVATMVAVTSCLQFASLGIIFTFNTSEDTTVALGIAPRISTKYLISSSVRFATLGRFALKNAVTNGSPVSESHT